MRQSFHSFGLDHAVVGGRHQERNEVLRRCSLGLRIDARRHDHEGLHVCRKYSAELGAFDRQDFADRQHRQVRGAAQDVVVDLFTGCRRFRLDRVRDAKLLGGREECHAAGASRCERDRLRREQRLLECVDGADVRFVRACFDHQSKTRARDGRLRRHQPFGDQIVEQRRRQDRDIERFAFFDLSLQRSRQPKHHRHLVLRRLLELRRELVDDRLDADGREHTDLVGPGCRAAEKNRHHHGRYEASLFHRMTPDVRRII